MNNRKIVNALIRANDYIGHHRGTIILVMLGIILGLFVGQCAVTTGIQNGYWEKFGYYYEKPILNNSSNINATYTSYAGIKIKELDYSTHAYFTAMPQINQKQIIIFECKNSTLIITNNKLLCQQ